LPRSGSCDGWHRVKRPDPRQRFRFFLMVLEEARRPSCNLQVARSKERKQSPKEAENTMAKQIFFIHGAGNQHHPDGSGKLVASLKRELGSDYEVLAPDMPDPDNPAYKAWRDQIGQELGRLDPDVLLIGHSFGGSVLLKYLAEGTSHRPIASLFLVAVPFWGKRDWEQEYALPDDFAALLPPISHLFLYHSRSDEVVPFSHVWHYQQRLPQATVRVLDGKEHSFTDGLPQLVQDIQRL
jgi:uncharacterized protein